MKINIIFTEGKEGVGEKEVWASGERARGGVRQGRESASPPP